jgi:hypothetical protein
MIDWMTLILLEWKGIDDLTKVIDQGMDGSRQLRPTARGLRWAFLDEV